MDFYFRGLLQTNPIFPTITEVRIILSLLSNFRTFPGHLKNFMFSRTFISLETDNLIFQDFQVFQGVCEPYIKNQKQSNLFMS